MVYTTPANAMKRITVAILLAIASFVAPADPVIYQTERTIFQMILHFGTQQEVLDKCNSLHTWSTPVERAPRGYAIGCNAFHVTTNVCEIWTPRPKSVDDAATNTLGHETLHCYASRYHDAD
jgi:hypothetical protein